MNFCRSFENSDITRATRAGIVVSHPFVSSVLDGRFSSTGTHKGVLNICAGSRTCAQRLSVSLPVTKGREAPEAILILKPDKIRLRPIFAGKACLRPDQYPVCEEVEDMARKSKRQYNKPQVIRVKLDPRTPVLGTNCKTSGKFGPAIFGCGLPGGCQTEGS